MNRQRPCTHAPSSGAAKTIDECLQARRHGVATVRIRSNRLRGRRAQRLGEGTCVVFDAEYARLELNVETRGVAEVETGS